MLFSRFAPFGMWGFSSKATHAETIYRSLVASNNDVFSTEDGSLFEARMYATAMAFARALYDVERAGNQADPWGAQELLPVLESLHGLTPMASDSLHQRRTELALRMKLLATPNQATVVDGLRQLLGTSFVSYHTVSAGNVKLSPTDPTTGPGTFKAHGMRVKRVRIAESVVVLGSPVTVSYSHEFGDADALRDGEEIVVDPGLLGIQERVTVSALSATQFTATFANTHDPGSIALTAPFPFWQSDQRHSLIRVADAIDPETRRKVDDYMRRVARGVSTWDVVQGLGPLQMDTAPGIDIIPIPAVA